jgi:hypothetical protein
VDVVFYDRVFDLENRLAGTTVARSTDGGRTFRQIQVSAFSSNFDNAEAVFGAGFGTRIGDYLGMTMDRFGVSYPAWTGVSPNKFDSDIFTATVGRDRGESPSSRHQTAGSSLLSDRSSTSSGAPSNHQIS